MKRKMEQLRQEYVEIRAVVDAAEASSWRKLKEEENRVYGKLDTIYKVLLKKRNEMQSLKAEVELILVKGDEFEFLEVSCGAWACACVCLCVCACSCACTRLPSITKLIGVWGVRALRVHLE